MPAAGWIFNSLQQGAESGLQRVTCSRLGHACELNGCQNTAIGSLCAAGAGCAGAGLGLSVASIALFSSMAGPPGADGLRVGPACPAAANVMPCLGHFLSPVPRAQRAALKEHPRFLERIVFS